MIRLVYSLDLLEGQGEKEQCDLVFVERFWMIELMVVMLTSYSCESGFSSFGSWFCSEESVRD